MRTTNRTAPGLRLLAAAMLLAAALPAHAQLVFDGNLLFNNNATGTLAGQFAGASTGGVCAGFTAAQLGTVTYTHNAYGDPLLPNAPYITNVVPNFQPAPGSPAYGNAMSVANTAWFPNADGFFKQVCYRGAIGPDPGDDWTQGWTWWDSTGASTTTLHLTGMPDPRPLAIYDNINLLDHQYFGPDSNYLVRGQLRVKAQASLTVAPGVVIFEENASLGTIVVERGGRIWAVGNACEPITIVPDDVVEYASVPYTHTATSFVRGHCGGIVINGYARTNLVNSCAGDSAASEGGAIGYYGGNNDNDGSGALRYVRICFSGKEITPNNELNSFTFNACGRNTRFDYCNAFRGADDSFEWFGGAMDCTHLIGIDGTDDGYDWQMGTRNRSQFVILRPSPNYAPSGTQNGDKGIEADDNEFDFNATQCAGRSNCWLANFTIVGDKRTGAAFPGPAAGVNWRRGTGGTMVNSIICNFKSSALKIDDNATWDAHCSSGVVGPAVYCPGALGVGPTASGRVFVANSAPNPFRNKVNVNFTLPQAADVQVDVFSADGRRVATLGDGPMAAGRHTLVWEIDRGTPAGMYFYRVRAGQDHSTGKLVRVD